ncbi:hypothetical protein EJB05_24797 [Eragrostis curvula]|uniref:Uncharacterized protein n=1 Tax=Eragrostis curvula TaxID=38414 RepID=A0A5J9VBJ1_9POAL|nr:hypothetical protein EJB05_24797 [Eragrostis curvula]
MRGQMDDKTLPTILFAAITSCLVISANCARHTLAGEGVDGERYTGVLSVKPNSQQKKAIGSAKIHIVLCVKLNCSSFLKWKSCFCCETLQDVPCYDERQSCWDVCPAGSPARRVGNGAAIRGSAADSARSRSSSSERSPGSQFIMS